MADQRETSDSSYSASSSTNSESSDNSFESFEAETSTESSEEGTEGKCSKAKRQSTGKKATPKKPRSNTRNTNKKKEAGVLNDEEVNRLAEFMVTQDEIEKIEQEVREKLLVSQRVQFRHGREVFVQHLFDDSQRQNFQLIIIGFCRKFSFLIKKCMKDSPKGFRKAALSVAWMKTLGNFQSDRTSQERTILDRCLQGLDVSTEDAYAVISCIHELVYVVIHDRIRSDKEGASPTASNTAIAEETEDTLNRYCGAALCRMIKLRKETIIGAKGRGEITEERKKVFKQELEILQMLVMQDKSNTSTSLINLDEGNLTFPVPTLLQFLQSVDMEVREFANDRNLRKYHKNFPGVCQDVVSKNPDLEEEFKLAIGAIVDPETDVNYNLISGIFSSLVSKLVNTRINEYLNAKGERDLKVQGKVVDADEMLRPKLKSYALQTKRK